MKGQGPSHSWYFFSRSLIHEKKGQPIVVWSGGPDRSMLKGERNCGCQIWLVVPIPVVWLAKNGHNAKIFSCPPMVSISLKLFVRKVPPLCSWPANGRNCQPCNWSPW